MLPAGRATLGSVKTRNLLIWAAITLVLIVAGFAWFVASGQLDQLFHPDLNNS